MDSLQEEGSPRQLNESLLRSFSLIGTLIARQGCQMPKTKVLVVDDQPVVSQVCSAVLQKHGFEPVVVPNGLEGIHAYEKYQNELCLTLLDVSMPGMSGIEVARYLFTKYAHPNVILMTGYSTTELVPEEISRLCSVLQKPFGPKTLMDAVRKCLDYEDDRASATNA
jgi:two-component system, cell cycle sensor histidine kinase and response regulator CckA